jgi:hypothetical protein
MLKLRNVIFYSILLFQSNYIFPAPRQKQSISQIQRQQRQVNTKKIQRKQSPKVQQKKKDNSPPRIIKPNRQGFGVYLGVFNYGKSLPKDPCRLFFSFYCNGEVKKYRIINSRNRYNAYVLHNRLQEGYIYKIQFFHDRIVNLTLVDKFSYFVEGTITRIAQNKIFIDNKPYIYHANLVRRIICEPGGAKIIVQRLSVGDYVNVLKKDGVVKMLFVTHKRKDYKPFVHGTPGVKTLKNYIKTALSAVGTILYVYGGGWNCAFSSGGSPQSTTIGIPRSCVDFFQHRDGRYSYMKTPLKNGQFIKNPQKSYYPFSGYNEYYYGGFDCSSYIGWVLYNILNTESGKRSLNVSSTHVAKTYARWNYGTFTRRVTPPQNHKNSKFKVGNIFSVCGHVWICLGTCKDGSILFVHSVPRWSVYGRYAGGGVQMSAIGKNKKCDAYRLANFYMKKYYPEWYKRYRPILCTYQKYCNLKHKHAGMFQWNLSGSGLLKDPDHYANKYPHEILRDIFRNK